MISRGKADESVSPAKIAGTKCRSTAIFGDPAAGFIVNVRLSFDVHYIFLSITQLGNTELISLSLAEFPPPAGGRVGEGRK